MLLRTAPVYLLTCVLGIVPAVNAQTGPPTPSDTLEFRLRVKQVGEFFKRFNNTDEPFRTLFEDLTGNTLDRATGLQLLMDAGIDQEVVDRFIEDVMKGPELTLIRFFDADWYADVQARITFNGEPHQVNLTLQLEPDENRNASRWTIAAAETDFISIGVRDSTRIINPASHETRFISLYKVFADSKNLLNYTPQNFRPDHLSVLLYAAQSGQLTYEGASSIVFHFLQIEGWTFRVARRNEGIGDWGIIALQEMTLEEKESYRAHILFEH